MTGDRHQPLGQRLIERLTLLKRALDMNGRNVTAIPDTIAYLQKVNRLVHCAKRAVDHFGVMEREKHALEATAEIKADMKAAAEAVAP